jgi:vacuolar-type H+-ATPase subunit E/Vma4
LSKAKAQAGAIVSEAKTTAEKLRADGEKAAADYAERARESLRQSARDTIRTVENAIVGMLGNLLEKDVEKALGDTDTILALVKKAIVSVAGDAEVAVAGPELAAALKAQLAAEKNIKIVLDETLGSGFSVRVDGGRVEHSFTAETIAGELMRRLRPDLAELLK